METKSIYIITFSWGELNDIMTDLTKYREKLLGTGEGCSRATCDLAESLDMLDEDEFELHIRLVKEFPQKDV